MAKIDANEFRVSYYASGPNALGIIKDAHSPFPVNEEIFANYASKHVLESLADINTNYVIFPFFLGFPPEIANDQREAFANFNNAASEYGIETLALITIGSYMSLGTYKKTDFPALLPNGKPIYVSNSKVRRCSCLTSEEWKSNVVDVCKEAVSIGASGVFIDSVHFGAAPSLVKDHFIGNIGCCCERCRKLFNKNSHDQTNRSASIPVKVALNNLPVKKYIEWRASVVTAFMADIKTAVYESDPDSLFTVSAPHFPYLPVKTIYGIDPEYILKNADVCFTENHRLTKLGEKGLHYSSPGLKVLQSFSGDSVVASLTYDLGPSHDEVPSPSRLSGSISETFSVGACPVVRVAEYRGIEKKTGDSLLSDKYSANRDTISSLFNWRDKNSDLFDGVFPVSKTSILFSSEILDIKPYPYIKYFYSILQTLTEIQIPVNVIYADEKNIDSLSYSHILIIPEAGLLRPEAVNSIKQLTANRTIIYTGECPSWLNNSNSISLNTFFKDEAHSHQKSYKTGSLAKRIANRINRGGRFSFGGFPISSRAGLPVPILSSYDSVNYEFLPPENWKVLQDIVREALRKYPEDYIFEAPPYIHINEWKKGHDAIFHIVNLIPDFPGPSQAALKFTSPVNARVIEVGKNKITYLSNESTIVAGPQPYTLIEVKNRYKNR